VNANTATIAEPQSTLEANGVSNAARWAREVDEYRPYPTGDPGFGKLRQELAKYRPDQATLEKIVASLSL
jgi:competence protein ComEA